MATFFLNRYNGGNEFTRHQRGGDSKGGSPERRLPATLRTKSPVRLEIAGE
ncbi:hypothetical protein LguiB_006642 [Lonicera macranthoides]